MKNKTKQKNRARSFEKFKAQIPLHLMLAPGIITLIIFHILPLVGIKIAFQHYIPAKGFWGDQVWVGWNNFKLLFSMPRFPEILRNTIVISMGKIFFSMFVAVLVSILFNEVRSLKLRKSVQTIVYVPYFISWVVFGGILMTILSPSDGIVGKLFQAVGLEAPFFLGDPDLFPWTIIVTDCWKDFGMDSIVYLAAITGIDPGLHESAAIDGANRFQRIWHITLPAMMPIILLKSILAIGSVLNAGFGQILILINDNVMSTGDIIDTFVYRMGLVQAQYGLSSAAGLFKSFIGMVMTLLAYYLAHKYSDYKIW